MRYQVADLKVNTDTMKVVYKGSQIPLTKQEYSLLLSLLRHQGMYVRRDTILVEAWDSLPELETRVVDVYIGYLRKKLDPKLILTVRGKGYMIQ